MKVIRISDIVHEQLKREAKADGRTLQWLVERKLTGEIPPSPKNTEAKILEPVKISSNVRPDVQKIASEATPDVSDLFPSPDADDIKQSNAEQPCCEHPTRPCKHWVWDTERGDGYRNTLSGRFREAD